VIHCEPTGNMYVGASVNIVKRVREHFYRLERNVHRNRRFQHAYNKCVIRGEAITENGAYRSPKMEHADQVRYNKFTSAFSPRGDRHGPNSLIVFAEFSNWTKNRVLLNTIYA